MAQFQYCLNSSTIRPTPILEQIAVVGETGYTAIELWHDDIDAHLARGGKLADIRKALIDHNLALPTTISLKGWFDLVGANHQPELEECKRRMDQAAALGAVHIIASPPLGKTDRGLGGQNYLRLLELGIERGVEPAMEYLGFAEDINTIEAAVEIIDIADHPAATIVHDPFHIFRGGGSVESLELLPAHAIAICHFNDAPADIPRTQQRDKDRVMPGDGHLDLARMVGLLREIEYGGYLSLELFRDDLWARDPREVAREGLEKMRAIVES
jgi:sugar phosphate isomerase/epimerase